MAASELYTLIGLKTDKGINEVREVWLSDEPIIHVFYLSGNAYPHFKSTADRLVAQGGTVDATRGFNNRYTVQGVGLYTETFEEVINFYTRHMKWEVTGVLYN